MNINEKETEMGSLMQSLQKSHPSTLPRTTINDWSISVYADKLTTENTINQVKRLKKAFPSLPSGFYDIMIERIKDKNFTDHRLNDAVNNLIDNCRYPTPVIADIISWDKRIQLYTYNDMVEMVDKFGSKVWDMYKAVEIPNVNIRIYAQVSDIIAYNLKIK